MTNMRSFIGSKEVVAQFVNEALPLLKPNSQLTTTITADPLGVYCAITATEGLSEDIDEKLGQTYFSVLTNTLPETI